MAKREMTLEIENPEVLQCDEALTAMAEIILEFAVSNGLFNKGAIKCEQKTKVLSLRPRSEREKLRQEVGRRAEESCDCVYG